MPEKSRRWITWSVAIVEDANGNRFTLIGTSEEGGYLRGIKPLAGEIVVSGNGHAERDVIDYAIANGLRVIEIGATRPICGDCANAIAPTGAAIVTPLRKSSGEARHKVDEDTQ
jgi:filamentous hemagglutinin